MRQACPTCDREMTAHRSLVPGQVETVAFWLCWSCQASYTPGQLEDPAADAQIKEAYREDCHRGSRGGSGGTKGRRESKPGDRMAREERRRNRTLEVVPLGPPDRDPGCKDRLTSSVHSVRLSAETRATLKRLREVYGVSEAVVLEMGIEALASIDAAKAERSKSA